MATRHRPGLISPPARVSATTNSGSSNSAAARATTPVNTSSRPYDDARRSAANTNSGAVRVDFVASPPSAKQLLAQANKAAESSAAHYAHEMAGKYRRVPGSFALDQQQQQQQQETSETSEVSRQAAARQREQEDQRFSRALYLDQREAAAPPHSMAQLSAKEQRPGGSVPEARAQERRHEEHMLQYQQQFLDTSAAIAERRDPHLFREQARRASTASGGGGGGYDSRSGSLNASTSGAALLSPTKAIQQQRAVVESERLQLENRWLNQQMQLYSQRARSAEAELSDLRSRCTCGAAGRQFSNQHQQQQPLQPPHQQRQLLEISQSDLASLFPQRPFGNVTRENQLAQAATGSSTSSFNAPPLASTAAGASRALLTSPKAAQTPPATSRALLASFGGNAKNLPASATVSFAQDETPLPSSSSFGAASQQKPTSSSASSGPPFRLMLVGGTIVMVRNDSVSMPLSASAGAQRR